MIATNPDALEVEVAVRQDASLHRAVNDICSIVAVRNPALASVLPEHPWQFAVLAGVCGAIAAAARLDEITRGVVKP